MKIRQNYEQKVSYNALFFDAFSLLITGYQIFHNYVRPHMGLDGKTPSEACGITIQGDDKWKTLIQRASL